ncbi:hypothetical protein HAX54_048310 [Datura stramonium]|uniref:Uncharacterized protein n=1 Tax=Datura stramonium TaxID=4076 RepID=A0ABS8WMZ1_DATST|nr:hypothetical protein [Datura stramonium]
MDHDYFQILWLNDEPYGYSGDNRGYSPQHQYYSNQEYSPMQDAKMIYSYSPWDAERTPYYFDQDPCFHDSSHHGYWASQAQCPNDQSSRDEQCNLIQDWNLEQNFDSKGSRLESRLNRVIQNQEKEESTLRNMIDVMSNSIIGFCDAFESNEDDSSTYCLVVTIRSGKVLQPRPHIPMEEEINIEEELSPNIGLAHGKVKNDSLIEEMNEEPKMIWRKLT